MCNSWFLALAWQSQSVFCFAVSTDTLNSFVASAPSDLMHPLLVIIIMLLEIQAEDFICWCVKAGSPRPYVAAANCLQEIGFLCSSFWVSLGSWNTFGCPKQLLPALFLSRSIVFLSKGKFTLCGFDFQLELSCLWCVAVTQGEGKMARQTQDFSYPFFWPLDSLTTLYPLIAGFSALGASVKAKLIQIRM